MSNPPLGEAEDLRAALVEVARAIADSLDVKEVWLRVARACRVVVRFNGFGVAQLDGEMVHLSVTTDTFDEVLENQAFPRSAFSPTLWPDRDDFYVLIHDAFNELDRGYAVDRYAIERKVQSFVRLPLGRGVTRYGSLVLTSFEKNAFTLENVRDLRLVAELVSVALAHQRLAVEASRAERLEQRVQILSDELDALSPHQTVGRSKSWKDVLSLASKVAPTETTVLITGESGTGKEVVARFVHRGSTRHEQPFFALNCAALPEQLLESELFGHEKGAFTGAVSARPGKIEQAAGGVLFLDEVGEMSPGVQAKFLRVLQEREFQRLGGTRTLKADVRFLAATNRDLKAAIGIGSFREDLYYRLAVFEIPLPPLRERTDDILLLVATFLEQLGKSVGRSAAGLSDEARKTILEYSWPGNVRELRNAIERAVILCEGGLITSEHLPITVVKSAQSLPAPSATLGTLDATEREMILQALTRAGNNKSKAARLLGLTRAQLRSRIEKHGLSVDD